MVFLIQLYRSEKCEIELFHQNESGYLNYNFMPF